VLEMCEATLPGCEPHAHAHRQRAAHHAILCNDSLWLCTVLRGEKYIVSHVFRFDADVKPACTALEEPGTFQLSDAQTVVRLRPQHGSEAASWVSAIQSALTASSGLSMPTVSPAKIVVETESEKSETTVVSQDRTSSTRVSIRVSGNDQPKPPMNMPPSVSKAELGRASSEVRAPAVELSQIPEASKSKTSATLTYSASAGTSVTLMSCASCGAEPHEVMNTSSV